MLVWVLNELVVEGARLKESIFCTGTSQCIRISVTGPVLNEQDLLIVDANIPTHPPATLPVEPNTHPYTVKPTLTGS